MDASTILFTLSIAEGIMNSTEIICGLCGKKLQERTDIPADKRKPCPKCGSVLRTFHVRIQEEIKIFSKFGIKAKAVGEKRPFLEEISGDDLHHKSGRWNKLLRIIDRRKNKYIEKVTDPETGQIIHECSEQLSDHRGHGDAKKVKTAGKPGGGPDSEYS